MSAGYARAAEAATGLLLQQRLYSLRIDVRKLAYDRMILFDSMQNYCRITRTTMRKLSDGSDALRDGCTLRRRRPDGIWHIVLYNEDATHRARRAFTLAHEVGHIYLEHRSDGDEQEREANYFAAQLLAPKVLVYEMARRSPAPLTVDELCEVFSLSRQAAQNRIDEVYRRRPVFCEEERDLLERYEHFLPEPGLPVVDV